LLPRYAVQSRRTSEIAHRVSDAPPTGALNYATKASTSGTATRYRRRQRGAFRKGKVSWRVALFPGPPLLSSDEGAVGGFRRLKAEGTCQGKFCTLCAHFP
jgi:hypothetical protein